VPFGVECHYVPPLRPCGCRTLAARRAANRGPALVVLGCRALHQARRPAVLEHIIKPTVLGVCEPDSRAVAEALSYFRVYAAILDDHLKSRRYVVADTLSVADFAIGATLPYAQAARIPIGDFPAIALWHERLNALPAWREPFPINS